MRRASHDRKPVQSRQRSARRPSPGCSRSSRAISESCSEDGMASRSSGPSQHPLRCRFPHSVGFQHRLRHLLDIEWHAVSARSDLIHQCQRKRLGPGDAPDDVGHRFAPETVERQPCDDRVASKSVFERRSRPSPAPAPGSQRCAQEPDPSTPASLDRSSARPPASTARAPRFASPSSQAISASNVSAR